MISPHSLKPLALVWLLALYAPTPAATTDEPNRYRLSLSPSDPRTLSVEARISVDSGELTMDWSGAGFLEDGWATFLGDLEADDPGGAEIEVEYRSPGRWTLSSNASTVHLSYSVRLEHDRIAWDEGGHDESVYVLDDLAFFVGKAVFVLGGQSESTFSDERFVVELDLPPGWEVTTPWERLEGQGHRFLAVGPRALIGAGVLVGRQERRILRAGGLEVAIAVGHDYAEVLPILERMFEPLVPAAVELFGSTPGSKFVFLANQAPRTETISPYFSGGVLDRTMSFIAPGPPEAEMMPVLNYIVTHEFLHLWNGLLIRTADDEREAWFSEGFTDYLTIRLLHAMGVLDREQMLSGPHGFLDNYEKYRNVAGTLSLRNGGLAKEDHYDLVYSGGFVFALALDLEMRRHGNPGRGVLAYMRELNRRAIRTRPAEPLSFERLEDLASRIAGVDLSPLFRDHVAGVEVLELDDFLAHAGLVTHRSDGRSSIETLPDAGEPALAVRAAFLAPLCCADLRDTTTSGKRNPGESQATDADAEIRRLERAIENDPDNADLHMRLGYAFLEKFESAGLFGKSSLAGKIRSAYERAVHLDPDHVEARVALANYYREAPGIAGGSRKKARVQAREILERDATQGHLALAEIAAAEKNWSAAEREYGLVLESDPGNADAHVGIGFIRQRGARWGEAFESFESALRADPENSEAYYQIGRTGALSGANLERALQALQHYIDRYADREEFRAPAYWRLGMLYEHLGSVENAVASYRQALDVDPGYDEARKALKKLRN